MPAVAALTSVGGSGAHAAAASACYGTTHNPHNSTHYPGYVLVSSDTVCPGYAVTVNITLYREVFGSLYYLARGSGGGAGKVTRNAKWKCPKGTTSLFVGFGVHTATQHTIANTENSQTVTCT
jgi:hypothetical protein